ncbi:MAG: cysteine hydrolase family protein [Pyrinomonadaceae bacterium]
MSDKYNGMAEHESNGRAGTALVLIDLVSRFDFEDGEKLFEYALPAARRLVNLKSRAKAAGLPVVYVNDNFGKWQEDFKAMVREILDGRSRGREIVELLRPDDDDFYVLKPQRSAFFSTTLELLLQNLGVRRLIFGGVTTDICILNSAIDAYMRDYEVAVPRDCVAAVEPEFSGEALRLLERTVRADTRPSDEVELEAR